MHSERLGGKVRQITLLSLGRNFSIKQAGWAVLCRRIDQLSHPQELLLLPAFSTFIESAAQRYAGQLWVCTPAIERMGRPGSELATWDCLQEHSTLGELIDIDFLEMCRT